MDVHAYLVLKYDGTTARLPVIGGDSAQAHLRASLSTHAGDHVVAVSDNVYMPVRTMDYDADHQRRGGTDD